MQALGGFGGGSPTIASPAPFPFVLPALLFGLHPILIATGSAVLFLIWIRFFSSAIEPVQGFPRRSWILVACISASSIAMYACGWEYGLKYEDARYVYSCATLSGAFGILSAGFAALAYRRGRFPFPLVAHTSIFVWLVTYAHPWLGETP
jgi:hypothetical protein